jgi:hypothetical protein
MSYVVPVHQRRGVLLSPDAGVWVGISKRNSSQPTRRTRVGFVLIRNIAPKPDWADVSSIGEFKYMNIQGES